MLDLEKVYEALLHWRGNLNATEFANSVGLTRQHVQNRVITPFLSKPSNEVHEIRGRKHGRTLVSRPDLSPRDIWSFFGLLSAERAYRRRKRSGLSSLADIDIVELAPPDPSDASVWVCRAAARKCVLVGNYLFKNHGVRAVEFSPHTMIRTPRRIHFRGHLLVRSSTGMQDWGYVDLVPARFLDDSHLELVDRDYRSAKADREWHEKTELVFQINPNLPRDAYYALQLEHGLEADRDGRCFLRIETKRALVHYYVHHIFDRTIGPGRINAWAFCPEHGTESPVS